MRCLVLFVVFAALLASGEALARRHKAFGPGQQQKKKAQAAGKTYTFDGISVTQKQIDDFVAQLKSGGYVMKAAKTFTHWSNFDQCLRWGIQGYVNDGEMAFLTTPEAGATRSRAGPGMYLADSETTSRSFGLCATSFQIDAGTLMWNENLARSIFKVTTSAKSDIRRFKTELGRVVPFIDFYGTSSSELWYVTHHTGLCQKVSMNWKLTLQRLRGGNIPAFVAQLSAVNLDELGDAQHPVDKGKWRDSIGFFTSLYHLMYYLDPISFMRAVKVMPDNPWGAFEPEYFGRFKDVRSRLQFEAYIKKASKGVTNPKYQSGADFPYECKFGDGKDPTAWANKVLDEVFASFPKQFAGMDMKFRNKYVRAGGDEPGRTFYSTGYQVTEMAKNPFLKVGATAKKGGVAGDYLTCYLYPDLKEWTKPAINPAIAPYIPVDMVKQLAAQGDQAAYEKFLRALLVGVLKTLFNKPVAETSQIVDNAAPGLVWKPLFVNSAAVDAMQKIISIHPFGNFNGRSVRLFAQLAAMECQLPVPIPAVGDLDTVESLATFSQHVDATTAIYEDLQRQMLDLFWTYTSNPANGAPKNNEYFNQGKIKWNDIAKSLAPLGIDFKGGDFTPDQLKMIDKRQWNPFFDSIGGSSWKSRRAAAAKAPSLPFDDNGKTYDVDDKGQVQPTDPAVKVQDLYWQA